MKTAAQAVRTPEEIWHGDLLGRQAESQLLIGYIESVAARPSLRHDMRSFTVAIDTDYGAGKTFFLRRLAEHLSINHPVAFVDAWKDDICDEPLTAIASTLQTALEPVIRGNKKLAKKLDAVIQATGEVAKIAAVGLAKRAVGLLVTSTAVAAAEEVIATMGEGGEQLRTEAVGTGERVVNGMEQAIALAEPKGLMAKRIQDFRAAQGAIQDLSSALHALVDALDGNIRSAPIVIVVDELDRCRPTYAIRLLEEIKHLFDVPGLVFVLGMHGDQLAHSVKAAYGSEFNGRAYLSRFIGRRYKLRTPNIAPLVKHLMERSGVSETKMHFLPWAFDAGATNISDKMAAFMRLYGVTPRQSFQVIDLLQTSAAITGDEKLWMDYLVPLAIGRVLDAEIPQPQSGVAEWSYHIHTRQGQRQEIRVTDLVAKLHSLMSLDEAGLRTASTNNDAVAQLAFEIRNRSRSRGADPGLYSELLDTVGRFTT